MSVCELISIHTGIYKYFYIWTSVSIFSQMLVHTVTDRNPLPHRSFYLLPSLCAHSPSNREKSGSFYLPHIYFHFTSRIQTEPYQNCSLKVPSKATFIIEWLYAILLAFSHRDSTHSKIIWVIIYSLDLVSKIISFIIQLDCFGIVYIPSWDPTLSWKIFLFAYALLFVL